MTPILIPKTATQDISPTARLWCAVQSGNVSQAMRAVEDGADINLPDENGRYVLDTAVANGHANLVSWLVAGGALQRRIREPSLIRAMLSRRNQGDHSTCEALLASGQNILDFCSGMLVMAAQEEDASLVGELLASGAPINLLCDRSNPILHHVAASGKIDLLSVLIQFDAPVNMLDSHRRTPLHYAARAGNLVAAELLLSAGASINCEDEEGKTPLMEARDHGHKEVEELLTMRGSESV